MWIVTLCARQTNGELKEHTVKIKSNAVEDLFDCEFYRWKILMRLMEKKALVRVKIDYKEAV